MKTIRRCRLRVPYVGVVLAWLSLLACDSVRTPESVSTSISGGVEDGVEATRAGPKIVALGDSLTDGLGLQRGETYPVRLQEILRAEGYDVEVVNASVSGDTTAGGLRRLGWALEGDVRILIVALGGNDGLRGLPVGQMKENRREIVTRAHQKDVAVLLAGMEAPPNFGSLYTDQFREVFHDLAREYEVGFVPFLLEGVAGNADLNQADGIHPTAEGARMIAAHMWPVLQSMLDKGE